MNRGRPFAYAWYRMRTTMRTERLHLVVVALLIGAMGGLALAAVAGARTTQSSFSDYVTASHVPQLYVFDGVINPSIGLDSAYNPELLRTLAHLPYVRRVASMVELNLGPLTPTGRPILTVNVPAEASVAGLDYTADPISIVQGRMPNPRAPDEFALDAASARTLGYHVGEEVPVGWVSNTQANSGDFTASTRVPLRQRAELRLVGLAGPQPTALFEDQDDAASANGVMLLTPALTNRLLECCSNDMLSGLTLQGGEAHLSAVEREVRNVLPKGLPDVYVQLANVEATAQATLRPEAIALAVFGGIAGVASLLITGQMISRRLRLRADDLDVARALGADPAMTFWDGLLGTLGAVLIGSVLAVVVALALSPLGPLGPVRSFLPAAIRADWTVLGFGFLCFVVVLAGVAGVASARSLPGPNRIRTPRPTSSRVTTMATRAGLPPAAVTGVRFALEPGAGRSAVPVRSAIVATVLAVVVVVATVTFGASLNTLVSHPALYGWNWTYDMDGGGGLGDVPGQAAARLLNADPTVESWSGVSFSSLQLDGLTVPVLGTTPHARVAPPVLSGHGLDGPDQVVLGASTLRQLGKAVGQTVEERAAHGKTTQLTIVGTATLPPIGVTGSSHLEMGSGAEVASRLIPAAARNLFEVTPGPNAILIRTRGGPSPQALHNLQALGRTLNIAENGGSVLAVQRPAEIINYGSLGSTPLILGVALAAGAAIALGITLVNSVRRRRRDLAILKTLGFTRRQLAAAIAIQASVAAVIGCAVGIPLGVALGRVLWNLFAAEINAVPLPTVPAGDVVLIGLLTIALAALVATVPGRLAARTHTAQLLRAA
jgi:hypothetical protein